MELHSPKDESSEYWLHFGCTLFQTNDSNKSVGNIQSSTPGMEQKKKKKKKNQLLKAF